MVQIAEEFIEAVIGREVLVLIAQMVLAELARRVASGLQDIGDRGHPFGDAVRVARHADGQKAGAERFLPQNERGAARRAALLAIGIGEDRSLRRDAVDVGRTVTHQAHRIGADLGDADIVSEDDENVGRPAGRAGGRLRLRHSSRLRSDRRSGRDERSRSGEKRPAAQTAFGMGVRRILRHARLLSIYNPYRDGAGAVAPAVVIPALGATGTRSHSDVVLETRLEPAIG